MDNNKKVQMNKIEYENMKVISKINSVDASKSNLNTTVSQKFKDIMKDTLRSEKKKKYADKVKSQDDIVVDESLQELIDEEHEVERTIEEKMLSSTLIKKLLSDEDYKENTPSDENIKR